MKLSTALILASATSAVSATTIRSASVKAALLNKSRRLEENANEDLYAFLSSYSLKLVGCANGQQSTDANGGVEYSTVVYRLCPADSCDDSSSSGCKKGFGDFAVGLNTFVQAWLEDKRESMQQDDMFKVEEFGECREYKVDNDAEDEDENQYFVGPTCGGDKTATVKLGLFTDETCTTVASKTFEEISKLDPANFAASTCKIVADKVGVVQSFGGRKALGEDKLASCNEKALAKAGTTTLAKQ